MSVFCRARKHLFFNYRHYTSASQKVKAGQPQHQHPRISSIRAADKYLEVSVDLPLLENEASTTTSNKVMRFPYSFLRDSCKSNFHTHTLQRRVAMCPEILKSKPKSVEVLYSTQDNETSNVVKIEWDNDVDILSNESEYCTEWLLEHSLNKNDRIQRRLKDLNRLTPLTKNIFNKNKVFDYQTLLVNDNELEGFLSQLWKYGLVKINKVPNNANGVAACQKLAEHISFLKETNYSRVFDVEYIVQPNNQAFTSDSLPLHADLPFYKEPPHIQMLHCISQAGKGGDSWFCDGISAAEKLKITAPESFKILCTKQVQFSDHNDEFHLRAEKKIIETIGNDKNIMSMSTEDLKDVKISSVYFNEGVRCQILNCCDYDEVDSLYQAFIDLKAIHDSDPELRIEFAMQSGDMMVFNNCRVLHGRNAFEVENSNEQQTRHLQGCYIDWDDALSKTRVIKLKQNPKQSYLTI